jgi:hypothetical protein
VNLHRSGLDRAMRQVFVCICFVKASSAMCQTQNDSTAAPWHIVPNLNFYFIPKDFFILPVLEADKGSLHLEARYNYEDRETFSAWAGYNFTGGGRLAYTITPMGGLVTGRSNGAAPGLRFSLDFWRLSLSSESEYFFPFEAKADQFYYNWSDLSCSITEWLWAGVSIQRTRAYRTDLAVQYGALLGAGYKRWEINAYLYDMGTVDTFLMVSLSASF